MTPPVQRGDSAHLIGSHARCGDRASHRSEPDAPGSPADRTGGAVATDGGRAASGREAKPNVRCPCYTASHQPRRDGPCTGKKRHEVYTVHRSVWINVSLQLSPPQVKRRVTQWPQGFCGAPQSGEPSDRDTFLQRYSHSGGFRTEADGRSEAARHRHRSQTAAGVPPGRKDSTPNYPTLRNPTRLGSHRYSPEALLSNTGCC